MQQWVAAARAAGVTIVWAPSDVTNYYANSSARANTLATATVPLPPGSPIDLPPLPLQTSTDGGCDTNCTQGSPWTHQIDTLLIEHSDYLISAEVPAG